MLKKKENGKPCEVEPVDKGNISKNANVGRRFKSQLNCSLHMISPIYT